MSDNKNNMNDEKIIEVVNEENTIPEEEVLNAETPVKEEFRTPGVSTLMYITGFLFLAIALFMLCTAVSYTRTYLDSYEATFAAMWSHSVQYIIGQFAPYFGIGMVLIGLAGAVKEFAKGRSAREATPQETKTEEVPYKCDEEAFAEQIDAMTREIEALRQVTGIKIEETEKRQTYRLEDNRKILEGRMATDRYDREVSEKNLLEKINGIAEALEAGKGAKEEAGQAETAGRAGRSLRRGRRFIK